MGGSNQNRGMFVLVSSNINIGFQKSLTSPLNYNFKSKQALVGLPVLFGLLVKRVCFGGHFSAG